MRALIACAVLLLSGLARAEAPSPAAPSAPRERQAVDAPSLVRSGNGGGGSGGVAGATSVTVEGGASGRVSTDGGTAGLGSTTPASDAGEVGGRGASPGPESSVSMSAPIEAPPPRTLLPVPAVLPPAASIVLPTPATGTLMPAPSASVEPISGGAQVRLGDSPVFVLRAPRGSNSPADRARLAERALAAAVTDERARDVKVVRQPGSALIYAGPVLIVHLDRDDARLAGDQSLDVLAGAIATDVRKAIEAERNRRSLAEDVFSVSLVVFLALIALFLLKKLGEIADRTRAWVDENGDRALAIRVQRIELVRPATVKSAALITIGLAKLLGQFGILFAWLVFVLSRFESTRGYTDEMTGFLVRPLSELVSRVATALPLLVITAIAALAVFVLVRFVGLFLASVERRDATLSWLPAELAAPTSVLIRVGIVISALVFAAPVMTGDADGGFARAGYIALVAIGLSSTPLLASGLVGAVLIFARKLRVGDHVEVCGRIGRISELTLFDVRLETSDRCELRVPHLALLRQPLSALGVRPRLSIEIAVNAVASPTAVVRLLEEAASAVGRDVLVEVLAVDVDGTRYRVSATCDSLDGKTRLARDLIEALAAAAIPLGRGSQRTGPS